jgi:hypothetical protein
MCVHRCRALASNPSTSPRLCIAPKNCDCQGVQQVGSKVGVDPNKPRKGRRPAAQDVKPVPTPAGMSFLYLISMQLAFAI